MERLLAALGASCAILHSTPVAAGPLTPPGTPAPTMKTLDQVEPSTPISSATTPGDADALFVISAPGAYHLTADIAGQTGRHGVQILSGDVTLDLRGYGLRGVATALDGVRVGETAGPVLNNIVVRGGRATGWGGSGFRADRANRAVLEGLVSAGNDAYGVIAGTAALVRDCIAEDNALTNISVAGQSVVERCLALRGGADGFAGASTSIFERCVAFLNQGDGFRPGTAATVTACMSSGNLGDGFDGGARSVFTGCSSLFDGGRGVVASADAAVRDCVVVGAPMGGVALGDGARVVGSSISAVTGAGISTGASSSVDRCTIRTATVGVTTGASSRIERCLVANISEDGVRISSHTTVLANTIDSCGAGAGFDGAGVLAAETANRIEGNAVSRCDYGVRLTGAANLVIGNSVAGAAIAAFDAVAGNAIGPILTSATITSSPAPNANFTP